MIDLTPRDIDIITYLNKNQGGTIEQIQWLFFKNYDTCRIRLKKLEDFKFIKSTKHPIINKKIYYIKKIPSYHTLVGNTILLLLKDKIKDYRREYQISNFKVDILIVTNSAKVIIIEIDIFNKTSKNKIIAIKNGIRNKLNMNCTCIIINKNKINKRNDVLEININDLNKLNEIIT